MTSTTTTLLSFTFSIALTMAYTMAYTMALTMAYTKFLFLTIHCNNPTLLTYFIAPYIVHTHASSTRSSHFSAASTLLTLTFTLALTKP
jgi:hypothetical protein